jgi:hypothetical protein
LDSTDNGDKVGWILQKAKRILRNTNTKTPLIFFLASVIYFPLIFLGYGTDCDSYRVVDTAKLLFTDFVYIPSRPPGYFVHEAAVSLLIQIGGSVVSNFGTMVMSLLTIYSFLKICDNYDIPHRHLLSIIMMIFPLYWINSTCTIDYLWAMGLALYGLYLNESGRGYLGASLLGISVGARLSSIIIVLAYFLAELIIEGPTKFLSLQFIISMVIGSLTYLPSFVWAGYSLGFFRFSIGDWTITEYLLRFAYKNLYFWGILTGVLLLFGLFLVAMNISDSVNSNKKIVYTSFFIIIGTELLYLRAPLEMAYLLPILPFVLILLALSSRNHRRFLVALLISTFSYNFVNFNFVHVDNPHNAQEWWLGFWLEWGPLIKDLASRLSMS